MAEVPVFIRIRGSRDGSVNATLGKVKSDVNRLAGEVVNTGQRIATVFGGASLGLVALGVAAARTAGQFEQLGAKLESVLKDSELAQQRLQQAAIAATLTPFSVEGIVTATVQLSAYGQRASIVLPKVADLAAAMGESVEDASQAIGKAASGSSEGFEILRNTYAVTTAELKQFGAEVDKNGGILLRTPERIEKARDALLKLIDVKFGGAAEKQSQTFTGAMSNLGDAAQLALAKVGSSLTPVATFLAKFATDAIQQFQKVSSSFVAVGVGGAALAAGFGAIASAALLSGAAIVSWYTGLQSAAATSTAAKAVLDGLNTSFLGIRGAAAAATTTVARFGTTVSFVAGSLTLATAAYVASSIAIRSYEEAQIRAGDAVEEASKKSVNATGRWRTYRDAINEAAKGTGVFVESGGRLGEVARQIEEAYDKASPAKFVASLEAAGINLEDTKKSLGQVGDELDIAQRKFQAISDAVGIFSDEYLRANNLSNRITFQAPSTIDALGKEGAKALAELFPEKTGEDIEVIRQQVKAFKHEVDKVALSKVAIETAIKAFEGFAQPLQEAIDSAERLDSFLKFSKSAEDLETLKTRLQVVGDEVKKFESLAADKGLPTQIAALRQELLTASGTRAEFIKSYLGILEQQGSAQKALADQELQIEQEKLSQVERTQARRRALAETTAADEVKFAEERLAVVRGSLEEELRIIKELDQARAVKKKDPETPGIDSRISELTLELDAARKLADEEIKARTSVREARKRLEKENVDIAKQALQDQTSAARDVIQQLNQEEGFSATAALGSLDQVLQRLQQWENANKSLLASDRDLRRSLEETRDAVRRQQDQVRDRAKRDRLTELKQKVSLDVSEAEDSKTKLDAVRGAIVQLNAERQRGLIDAKAAEAELVNLKRQELGLTKDIAREEAAKANSLQDLKVQGLQSEIDLLKARQEAGENVTDALIAKEKEYLQARLDAIDTAAAAELAAQKDADLVEQTRQAKKKQVLTESVAAAYRRNNQDQTGGTSSPATGGGSFGQPASNGNPLGYSSGYQFKLGGPVTPDFGATFGQRHQFRKAPPRLPSPAAVARQIGFDKDGQKAAEDVNKGATTYNIKNEVVLNMESKKTRTVDDPKQAVKEVEKAITTNQLYDPNAGL